MTSERAIEIMDSYAEYYEPEYEPDDYYNEGEYPCDGPDHHCPFADTYCGYEDEMCRNCCGLGVDH